MSRSARINAPFGDGIHTFRLDIAGLEELQEKTDAGPEQIYADIVSGQWKVAHLRETVRIGLVRGGMEPMRALALVGRYAAEGYLADLKPLALNIIAAALVGAADEDKPSGEPEAGAKDLSPAERSGSENSTRRAPKSDSRRARSKRAPSGS
jgi:Phage tail tube protein, GTA-gp10